MMQRESQCLLLARAGVSGQESRGGPRATWRGWEVHSPDNNQMHFCAVEICKDPTAGKQGKQSEGEQWEKVPSSNACLSSWVAAKRRVGPGRQNLSLSSRAGVKASVCDPSTGLLPQRPHSSEPLLTGRHHVLPLSSPRAYVRAKPEQPHLRGLSLHPWLPASCPVLHGATVSLRLWHLTVWNVFSSKWWLGGSRP